MANQKIIALNELTAIADNDMFAVSDVSATETKKIRRKSIIPELLKEDITSDRIQVTNKGGLKKCIDKGTGDTAITDTGFMESLERFGLYMVRTATAVSAEFDTAITRTGRCSIKLSATDATGQASIYTANDLSATFAGTKRLLIPVKASTKYNFNIFAKGKLLTADSVYATINTYDTSFTTLTTATSNKLGAGNVDWTLLQATITTGATAGYMVIGLHNMVAGTANDAYFDWNGAQLLEVGTDTTNANAFPTQIKPIFVGNSSFDGIDGSLDAAAAYTNTYTMPVAINEGATHRQTFTPTKNKLYKIGVYVVSKGTGDLTLSLHDASNNLVGGGSLSTILNASVVTGWNYFGVGEFWTSGAYHFHVTSTVADGTLKTNTTDDLEDASYIVLYARNSEGFELISNGVSTKMVADRDGFVNNGIFDVNKGTIDYYVAFSGGLVEPISDISGRAGTGRLLLSSSSGMLASTTSYGTIKLNTYFSIKKISIFATASSMVAGEIYKVQLSEDNITYTDYDTVVDSNGNALVETDKIKGNIVYIRLIAGNGTMYTSGLWIRVSFDNSSSPLPIFYPINSVIQETKSAKVNSSSVTRVYFRLAKYANANGVVQPCLEFMNTAANNTGAILFLDFDNSQETNPCVNINIAGTTGAQQSGTGSADSTTGYILNDGEYMTKSSSEDDIRIAYKVGYGTTTFNNPTKNAYYMSSSANSNDSTKDPSLQSEVIFDIPQTNVVQELTDLRKEVSTLKQLPNTKSGMVVGSGTDYTLTTSLAVIAFGTSGNLEVRVPEAGTYEITADIHSDASGVTASAAANYSLYQLYKDGNAVANSQRKGAGFPILAAALNGINSFTAHFSWIIKVETPNSLVSLYAKQNSATTGNWVITSGTTGRTRLGYKRLGN